MMDDETRQFLFENSSHDLGKVENKHIDAAREFLDQRMAEKSTEGVTTWVAAVAFSKKRLDMRTE